MRNPVGHTEHSVELLKAKIGSVMSNWEKDKLSPVASEQCGNHGLRNMSVSGTECSMAEKACYECNTLVVLCEYIFYLALHIYSTIMFIQRRCKKSTSIAKNSLTGLRVVLCYFVQMMHRDVHLCDLFLIVFPTVYTVFVRVSFRNTFYKHMRSNIIW